jgi:hypothetical protein
MKQRESDQRGGNRSDLAELVARCRAMETDLADVKARLAAIQRLLEQELRRTNTGNSQTGAGGSPPSISLSEQL